jgi:hypothetical protein
MQNVTPNLAISASVDAEIAKLGVTFCTLILFLLTQRAF